MADAFNEQMNDAQTAWRRQHIETREHGTQNGYCRSWILPRCCWEEGLWPGIRSGSEHALSAYIKKKRIQKHPGVHNLKSSWMLCANLYFSHRRDPQILAAFLADRIDSRIVEVQRLELEWVEKCPLDPTTLLGEPKGRRGANQTSPDIAFFVGLEGGGQGLILTENKFVEHSFYRCSGRKKGTGNPDIQRCLDPKAIEDPSSQCHLLNWQTDTRANRRYWEHINISEIGRRDLRGCPAALAGYQLFRQQALAEAIAVKGKYDFVVTSVAYDDRNETLLRSMQSTGIGDFTKDWGPLFTGQARFATFTHQEWVRWVRQNDTDDRWSDWLDWIGERYGHRG